MTHMNALVSTVSDADMQLEVFPFHIAFGAHHKLAVVHTVVTPGVCPSRYRFSSLFGCSDQCSLEHFSEPRHAAYHYRSGPLLFWMETIGHGNISVMMTLRAFKSYFVAEGSQQWTETLQV